MNVRFFAGTKAEYLSLPTPRNPLGLYFCADTQELFWADRLLTDGIRVVPTQQDLPECQNAADGIVYYVTETRNGYTLSPDRSKWLQTIYAPATDAYKVPESDIYNTVTTVGAVRDIENKIYDAVHSLDERVADIELSISDTGIKAISFAGFELTEADGVFTIDRARARRALGFIVPEGQESAEIEFATKAYVADCLESIQGIDPDEYAKRADLEGFVTKVEVDNLIADKADVSHKHESDYDIKGSANEALSQAKSYADMVAAEKANTIKNDLLDGAGEAFDTLRELGSLIKTNEGAIQSLENIATNKAEKDHTHTEYAAKEHEHIQYLEYVDNKVAGIKTPSKLSELENDTKFITETSLADYAKKSDIPSDYITGVELQEELSKIEHPSVDLTNYVTRDEIDNFISEIPTEYVTETELTAKGYLTEQNLSGYATESFVNEVIANIDIPEVNTKDFVTIETFAQTLGNKADEIPFATDKFVTNPIGNFVVGETLKSLSIAEILAKILGLSDTIVVPDVPEEPTSLTEKILAKSIPMYAVSNTGQLAEVPFKELDGNAAPTESGFFVIRDENGEITKAGYQDLSIANDEMYYVIALPKELDYNTMVTLEAWNSEESIWEEATMKLINDPDTVAELCAEEPPVDISHIDTNLYTIWVYEDICTGSILRYVIKEAK